MVMNMLTQNSINSQGQSFPANLPIYGGRFFKAFLGNAGAGDVDIYTAPLGKRAMVLSYDTKNTAVSTTSWFCTLKIGGVYYRLNATVNTSSTASSADTAAPAIILEPGETIAINTSQAGLNFWYSVFEYDATYPIYSSKILNLSSGDNTIYIIPFGKTASGLGGNMTTTIVASNRSSFRCINVSGGIAQYTLYFVPNGGAKGSSNQVSAATNVANNSGFFPQVIPCLKAGDFVVLNASVGTGVQTAWMNVVEV